MDKILNTAVLAGAEAIIAKALRYDPATRIALSHLAPQVLAIHITAPECTVFVAPDESGIRLLGHYEGDVAAKITGTLTACLSLAKSNHLNIKDSGVSISGSSHFIAELQRISKQVDIDWEEILSQLFGDVIGHQSAEFLRKKKRWTKDRANNIQRMASEFLTEELRALPAKSELDYFSGEVDELRLQVDRIEARIHRLHLPSTDNSTDHK